MWNAEFEDGREKLASVLCADESDTGGDHRPILGVGNRQESCLDPHSLFPTPYSLPCYRGPTTT